MQLDAVGLLGNDTIVDNAVLRTAFNKSEHSLTVVTCTLSVMYDHRLNPQHECQPHDPLNQQHLHPIHVS